MITESWKEGKQEVPAPSPIVPKGSCLTKPRALLEREHDFATLSELTRVSPRVHAPVFLCVHTSTRLVSCSFVMCRFM